MASAPNMRVAPSAAPTGTAAPAPADPLEFISRILAGQAQLTATGPAAIVTIGESPLPDGATADAAPEGEASADGDAVAADPAPLDGLIPVVLAQGDYAVAVVVKGNAADAGATETQPDSEAQAAPASTVATPVPLQAALPATVPVANAPQVAAKATSGDGIAASKLATARPIVTTKPIATKLAEPTGDADAEAKATVEPAPIPAPAATTKAAPAEKIIAPNAPTLRAAATDEPASVPAAPVPVSTTAPESASADAGTPKDNSAQIAAALRGGATIPDSGVRSTSRQRAAAQMPTLVTEAAPQAQPLHPIEAIVSDAQTRGPATGQDNAAATQPTAPWSPAVSAAPRPTEPAAIRTEVPDQAVDRALDLARDGEWLDRLARDISSSADRDGTLRFRLNPQALGQLRVELSQGEHGTNIRMSVDTEAARTILADAQSRLVSEARAQGVRIGETQVDLSGSDQHMSGDPRRQEEARHSPMIRTAPAATERDAQSRPARSRSDRYA